ncbi:MAG TPA: hypothetical protein VFE59_27840, partial [Trebonia sp.]|nr:hypothetical protein [Trebonia sp.]
DLHGVTLTPGLTKRAALLAVITPRITADAEVRLSIAQSTPIEQVDCAIGRIVSSGTPHQASPVPLLSITSGTPNPAGGLFWLVLGI